MSRRTATNTSFMAWAWVSRESVCMGVLLCMIVKKLTDGRGVGPDRGPERSGDTLGCQEGWGRSAPRPADSALLCSTCRERCHGPTHHILVVNPNMEQWASSQGADAHPMGHAAQCGPTGCMPEARMALVNRRREGSRHELARERPLAPDMERGQ